MDELCKGTRVITMNINVFDENSSQLENALRTFKMRSPDREVEVDQARLSSVVDAINAAIQDIVAERTGIIARVKTIVDQPYTVRKWGFWQRETQSDLSAEEFMRAEKRLDLLARQISDFELLKTALLRIPPDVRSDVGQVHDRPLNAALIDQPTTRREKRSTEAAT